MLAASNFAPSAAGALSVGESAPSNITPLGGCDTLGGGAIGYRNSTGKRANEYRRLGESVQGREIWAEHWGPKSGPQLLLIAQTHGDECAPAFLVREIRLSPPRRYGVWIVPTINPDGLVAMTRLNANKVDLNRDGLRQTQPETRALISFTKAVKPALSIHLHSPYAWVGWYNGSTALETAKKLSAAAGWGYPPKAGDSPGVPGEAFLWQGQAKALPGHQSVLVEFPAISKNESPKPPRPEQKKYISVKGAEKLASQFRKALDEVVLAKSRNGG